MKTYLAIDIGASSGRHIIGTLVDGTVKLDEVYRFETGFYREGERMYNDVEKLTQNVIEGIKVAFEKYPVIDSLSIDTWGVDYVLMQGDKPVLPVFAYRDERTLAVTDAVHGLVPFEKLYEKTGTQFQPFNTVYQLFADKTAGRLDGVTDFLMLPEYLAFRLTGVKMKEYTNASTTGLLNAKTGVYDAEIIKALALPEHLFGTLNQPGTSVGKLTDNVAKYVGGNTAVVLCASHDTASAVEGIPMEKDENALYISSGTWSLLGVKSPVPHTDEKSRHANYSNEGGVGYVRFQKNIMGMWIVNSLKNEICPDLSFKEVDKAADESTFDAVVDVNARQFFSPVSMKAEFDRALGRTDLSIGDYFRCAYHSLALGYKQAVDELQSITGERYEKLYIVGGGAKNKAVNVMTSEATGLTVVALPIEATTLGNIQIQIKSNI